ncbi:PepSY domain-containing protein [Geothermobacter hydrogeniphilus]|uniref:PepSY domain-containing protein n=1 Tax=Geothermobacter hydrogeniphilus TaxID=1969733 RepID=A0A1X0Y8F3_9BACT|nr:PepSY domain-containing protein [Geothermobacter hydrogeniphilus]ORJ61304.1 hypothetical protein B5V00_06635 [Geothermobacter hydrogeniphilus]
MRQKGMLFFGVLMVGLLAGTLAVAVADEKDAREMQALKAAKVSLTEAIAQAQDAAQGVAVSAELDDEEAVPVYLVEVVSGGRDYEVRVDPGTGKVLDKRLDPEDDDDGDHDKVERD